MKFSTILTLFLGIFVVSGTGYYVYSQRLFMGPQANKTVLGTTSKAVFGSIKEALTQSKSLSCEFTDEYGKTTVAYVKNGSLRADIVAKDPSQSGSLILKNNMVYFWNKQSAYFIAIPYVTVTPAGKDTVSLPPQEILDVLEKYKDQCKEAAVSDTVFVQPTTIKFMDFTKLFPSPTGKQQQKTGQEQQTVQQYLQQYQGESVNNK